MFCSPLRTRLTFATILLLVFCFDTQSNAQVFRFGNIMQAGGGQGFRLGGPRLGMHFGGGQGASLGGQNVGMRFGNGQGARIGGTNFGMQFGGQQGTQIGRFQTQPNVNPGTYYYGDVRQPLTTYLRKSPQPIYAGPTSQPTLAQRNFRLAPGRRILSAPPSSAAVAATPALTAGAVATTQSGQLSGMIRLTHPADAPADFAYRLNGTNFTLAPGKSVYMASGQQWYLEFSAGEGFGEREATLSESGDFMFQRSADEGWILVKNEPDAPATLAAPATNAAPTTQAAPTTETAPATQVVAPNSVVPAAGTFPTPALAPPNNSESILIDKTTSVDSGGLETETRSTVELPAVQQVDTVSGSRGN